MGALDLVREHQNTAGAPPRVTVIIAAYRRPGVLIHALRSALAQTMQHLEVLVIGDACSQETARIVHSVDDPRVHYVNLPRNTGDQSGPNSIGMELARGEHVAFLNQDDMWFPTHLETALARLHADSADLVLAPSFRILAQGPDATPSTLQGVFDTSTAEDYAPQNLRIYVASGLVCTSALARRVGHWRPAASVRYASSQDFIYRCWAAGARICTLDRPTIAVFPSAAAHSAYTDDRDGEQRLLAPVVLSGDAALLARQSRPMPGQHDRRARILGMVTWGEFSEGARAPAPDRRRLALFDAMAPVAARLGVGPFELAAWLRGIGRGDTNRILRSVRGLDPSDPR